jgi:hypothetical protein
VLVWLGVAAFLGAIALDARWALRARHARRWRQPVVRFPYVRTGALGVVVVLTSVPTYLREHEENRLARVASVLAGAPVTVHCQTLGEAFADLGAELGYVKFGADGVPEHHTTIKRDQCSDLRGYLGGAQEHPSFDQVIAVHVLTHESMHMKGLTDESWAECAAVQRDAETARLLGASPVAARALAVRYWHQVYPDMPDAYRSSDCVAGGRLDEHLPDAPWAGTATSVG